MVTYAGISAVFSWIRTWFSPHKSRRLQYFISSLISIPVGIVFGFIAEGLGLNQGFVFATVAAAALIAENIINVIIGFGEKFEKAPLETISKLKNLKDK